jgi:uncharacterized protein YdeI (YjbR/CyaY-like superfamily)
MLRHDCRVLEVVAMQTDPRLDEYIAKSEAWQAELSALSDIVLHCGLDETIKWNKPCYTFEGGNLIAIARLKDHCWLMFFKGALLEDTAGLLEKAGENSQSMRVIPFTSIAAITDATPSLRGYLVAVIAAERVGLKVDLKGRKRLEFPDELVDAFDANPDLRVAFDALTPGRQRGYNLFFCGAKQSATRASRISKYTSDILAGRGMHDR